MPIRIEDILSLATASLMGSHLCAMTFGSVPNALATDREAHLRAHCRYNPGRHDANGDLLPLEPDDPRIARLADAMRTRHGIGVYADEIRALGAGDFALAWFHDADDVVPLAFAIGPVTLGGHAVGAGRTRWSFHVDLPGLRGDLVQTGVDLDSLSAHTLAAIVSGSTTYRRHNALLLALTLLNAAVTDQRLAGWFIARAEEVQIAAARGTPPTPTTQRLTEAALLMASNGNYGAETKQQVGNVATAIRTLLDVTRG